MTEFEWVAFAVITVVSIARLTRLATVDKFPPIQWLRDKFEEKTDGTGWNLLTMCGYCFSFWVAVGVVGWAVLAEVVTGSREIPALVWWGVNGTFAAAYLGAIVMANDGDDNEEDD